MNYANLSTEFEEFFFFDQNPEIYGCGKNYELYGCGHNYGDKDGEGFGYGYGYYQYIDGCGNGGNGYLNEYGLRLVGFGPPNGDGVGYWKSLHVGREMFQPGVESHTGMQYNL
jgi:hypothetical protein